MLPMYAIRECLRYAELSILCQNKKVLYLMVNAKKKYIQLLKVFDHKNNSIKKVCPQIRTEIYYFLKINHFYLRQIYLRQFV